MIRILFYVVVVIVVVHFLQRLLTGLKPQVTTAPEGIAVRVQRTISMLAWSEIRQIDICRVPTAGVDHFAVFLIGGTTLAVYDHYIGFQAFTARLFERWPQIRAEWTRVFNGPPDISERITIWQRA
jgi:hypothetical protein